MQQQPAKVVFLDRETLAPEIHLAELTFPHELVTFGRTSPAETAERIRDRSIR
jgi:glycerate dehydrogenase